MHNVPTLWFSLFTFIINDFKWLLFTYVLKSPHNPWLLCPHEMFHKRSLFFVLPLRQTTSELTNMRGSFIFIKNVGFWMNLYWINMSFYYAIYRLYLVRTKKKYSKRVMNSPRTISRAKKCQSKFSSQFHNSNIKKDKHIFLNKQVKTFAILRRFHRINQPGYETCKL